MVNDPSHVASPHALLGGLTPAQFLRRHWQKTPLVVRAIKGFVAPISADQSLALALREDVEARLITRNGSAWTVAQGPFKPKQLKAVTRDASTAWTVLTQGVNTVHAGADALLRRFNFIPYARLDDLMVSVAGRGGGVGPHVDSYDVFLLQAAGRRRWRISQQADLSLRPNAPLKLLRAFKPSAEYVLDAGDMLYLPPGWAHDGVALDDGCMTYSIGFRALDRSEATRHLLNALDEALPERSALYADPALTATTTPAALSPAFLLSMQGLIGRLQADPALLADAMGTALSEPKPHIVFDQPEEPLTIKVFKAHARRTGLALDLRTMLLYHGAHCYINGERQTIPLAAQAAVQALANARAWPAGTALPATAATVFYEWYEDGWLHPAHPPKELP